MQAPGSRGRVAALVFAAIFAGRLTVGAGDARFPKQQRPDAFRQLEELLPTPNAYRTASGAPGHRYWQQRADYEIDVTLDTEKHRIVGRETIAYSNNSPDTLRYLWLQLEPNFYDPNSDSRAIADAPDMDSLGFRGLRRRILRETFDGGMKISDVKDSRGRELTFTVVKTMMRVDLPEPLRSGQSFTFSLNWNYNINNHKILWSRAGYELFEDGNALYEMAHWYPRMAAYTDVTGWQHKQFLGRGEFTLEFGDFKVRITAPADFVVASTGVLQNPDLVLEPVWKERLKAARSADKPMFIVTPEEAKKNASGKRIEGVKTWEFHAERVRDFAFAASRKFIWDAQGHRQGDRTIMAMSFYPEEGEPLWSRYSTHAIIHTLEVYSRYTFDYPYPVAISVNGPVGGMEYPMICFNGPRPEKDGTWSKRTKYGLISVIIHEVGHNYFPMIVNSDERQWTWMDEGLNTFLQYLSEQEWEEDYPSRRGEPQNITSYMKSFGQVPIMTNSESTLQFGNNAYGKPATALNILRETILGRELFDFAFKEYARRWKFKRPMPADFFRTMEDASGIDLDWFWRGWFYSTDHCDLAITNLRQFVLSDGDPAKDKEARRKEREARPQTLSQRRNKTLKKRVERFPELEDFYNRFDELDVTDEDRRAFKAYLDKLEPEDKELLKLERFFYVVDVANLGGLVMPVILGLEYVDGTRGEVRIPAEIFRRNSEKVAKLLVLEKELKRIRLDPNLETADVDLSNNTFPPVPKISRFKLFKRKREWRNAMQRAKDAEARKTKGKLY